MTIFGVSIVKCIVLLMLSQSVFYKQYLHFSSLVFDDADERTLRRTQLCLKGDKHFMESEVRCIFFNNSHFLVVLFNMFKFLKRRHIYLYDCWLLGFIQFVAWTTWSLLQLSECNALFTIWNKFRNDASKLSAIFFINMYDLPLSFLFQTLDNLPLSNPEHFGTPVIARGKRNRSSAGAGYYHFFGQILCVSLCIVTL